MDKQQIIKEQKPSWLKVSFPQGKKYHFIKEKRKTLKLSTVCEEARCPNIGECWSSGTATFMIMGDTCTRACRFCSVSTKKYPQMLDNDEPIKLAETLQELELKYVVITTVDRDDLVDQGASHIKKCIEVAQKYNPAMLVEILMPDFRGELLLVDKIIEARPAVIAHNIETVKNLTKKVRDKRAGYEQSLRVLEYVKKKSNILYTKSSIMVGFGEKKHEVLQAMDDLRKIDVDFLTIGQYLQPSTHQLKVHEYVHPDTFNFYKEEGLKRGFRYVASGPLVRSSYKAAEHFIQSILSNKS